MKRILSAALILAATTLSAQEPVRPAQAARPAAPPTPAAAPAPAARPMPSGQWTIMPAPPTPIVETIIEPTFVLAPAMPMTPMTPMAPMEPMIALPAQGPVGAPLAPRAIISAEAMPIYHEYQGQGRVLSRAEAERLAEEARERAREQAERQREQSRDLVERAREQAQRQSEMQREQARMQADRIREQAQFNYNYNYNYNYSPRPMTVTHTLPEHPPAAWAQNDPADSLWKAANDVMGKGDYRRAAAMFKEIPARFKYSQYAVDAMYWQAHALYRVGGNQDLQDALQVLETLKATYPSSRIRGNQADVGALQVRIAGVLSAKGMGSSKLVQDALSNNKGTCDSEDIGIKSAALNALMQTDPASAQEYAIKALAKKDECSRELRRTAVWLIGNKKDGSSARTLIDVAKNDPNADVRSSAIDYLGRMPSDEAMAALEDLLKTSDDQQIQRSAIRALAGNSNPKARAGIKALIERNDVNVNQRIAALDALREELATTEDVNWLQALYPKVDNPQIRARIISAMARLGGSQNEKWFVTLANNENESMDVRVQAIRQAGQSMDIPALGRLYDATGQRPLRQEIVRQFGNRREPETIDKLGEIAKNGTDPDLRRRAIDALMQKKDERANKLILSLIDRP